ncbi:hypothetical protein TWF730_002934 [Orbilia blumenaviensis]|uniref:Uncharacterized protein n=1 Tax=Orbilia blumenaviensis TaxID=1796055 RepID=A0AAV9UAI3_9PEZI
MSGNQTIIPITNGSADFKLDKKLTSQSETTSRAASRGSDCSGDDYKPAAKIIKELVLNGKAPCGCEVAPSV